MAVNSVSPLRGACDCGTCSFEARKAPKVRFICHCTICQVFTGKPYSDVSAMFARDVAIKNTDHIKFKKYRLPPNLNRGQCDRCGKPIVETAGFGPMKILFIPSATFFDQERLPPVAMHIFYDRRLHDAEDHLPKHSGYWPSQLAIGRLLTR
jgi:hypothetical protein